MNKFFWGFAFGSVVILAGSFFSAKYAMCYPESYLGQALHGASTIAAQVNPVASINAPLGGEEMAEGVPADPVPVEEDKDTPETMIRVPAGATAPIVIDETTEGFAGATAEAGTASAAPGMVFDGSAASFAREKPACDDGEAGVSFTICADETHCKAARCDAPATMSYCTDEVEVEKLPMPKEVTEEDGEESECCCEFVKFWMELIGVDVMPCDACPCEKKDCDKPCDNGCNYHHHHGHCPYSGKSYYHHEEPTGCDTHKPGEVLHKDSDGSEEDSEPKMNTARRKLRIFLKSAKPEFGPAHSGVDTMEYRPSDGQLYDYGPNPL